MGQGEEPVGARLSSGMPLKDERENGLDIMQLYVGSGLSGFRNNCSLRKKGKTKEQNTR